jgi:hypothetical protein
VLPQQAPHVQQSSSHHLLCRLKAHVWLMQAMQGCLKLFLLRLGHSHNSTTRQIRGAV